MLCTASIFLFSDHVLSGHFCLWTCHHTTPCHTWFIGWLTPPALFEIFNKALFLTSTANIGQNTSYFFLPCWLKTLFLSIILNKILRHGTMCSVALGFFFPVHGWKQDGFEKFDMTNSFLSFLFCNLNVRICCWETTATCFSLVRLFHSSFHFFFF